MGFPKIGRHTDEINKLFREKVGELAEPDLASEVSGLRREIAALRRELRPVPSLIATGQSVLDEFRRMAEGSKT